MSESSFSIRVGQNEISCAGNEQFLSEQIPVLLDYLKNLGTNQSANTSAGSPALASVPSAAPNNLAVNSIAAKIGIKAGTDLVLAAVYSLTRADKSQATRAEIVTEMKKATSYFKNSIVSNLSNYLSTLIKDGKLLEQGSENYALSVGARTEIESKLA